MFDSKKFHALMAVLIVMAITAKAQYQPIIQDNFSDSLQYRDLTTKFIWGSNLQAVSGFRRLQKADQTGLSFSAINQTDSARKYAGYIPANSLRASLSFDYRIPEFNRTTDSLNIEFDVLWDNLVSGGNTGRIVVALLHDLPQDILFNTILDSLNAVAPFGRPAYSFRILNRIQQGQNNYANMMYGGGKDREGEFEKFSGATGNWWLPGFISGPGGISPESNIPEYPLGPVDRWGPYTIASSTHWRHVTWKVFPEKLEVWIRNSSSPVRNDTLALMMVIPKPGPLSSMLATMQQGHGLSAPPDSLPTLYNWFEKVNGVRFYMNGANSTYFANVSIKGSYLPTSLGSKAENLVKDLLVYPNPASGFVSANFPEDAESYQIVNFSGQVMASGSIDAALNKWDTRTWPKGMYALHVKTKNGPMLKKFALN